MNNFNDDGVLNTEVIHEQGYDPNAPSRETPQLHITRIYAKSGGVRIEGQQGDKPVTSDITAEEATYRCRALVEMCNQPHKYPSDIDNLKRMLSMFVPAIRQAKKQLQDLGFAG